MMFDWIEPRWHDGKHAACSKPIKRFKSRSGQIAYFHGCCGYLEDAAVVDAVVAGRDADDGHRLRQAALAQTVLIRHHRRLQTLCNNRRRHTHHGAATGRQVAPSCGSHTVSLRQVAVPIRIYICSARSV